MKKLFYYVLLSIILYSCGQNNSQESRLNGFDISPDSKNVIFSYKTDSFYNIYIQSINTNTNEKPKIIFKGLGNYINPKFTADGNMIISLYYPQNKLAPEFHFYDLSTHKVTKKIKIDDGFVSDYTLSSNNLFYIQAKSFKSYSSIAPKSYHNYDIYELDLITKNSKKLSNLNSYYMGEILNWKKDSLLISIQGEPNESGLFFFNTKSNIDEKTPLEKVIIKNDTLRSSTMYANPIMLSNNSILCSSSYQMVKLDLKSKKEYPVLPSTGYHYSIIRSTQNIIFYKQNDDTNNIYYFNLNDKNIHSININLQSGLGL